MTDRFIEWEAHLPLDPMERKGTLLLQWLPMLSGLFMNVNTASSA